MSGRCGRHAVNLNTGNVLWCIAGELHDGDCDFRDARSIESRAPLGLLDQREMTLWQSMDTERSMTVQPPARPTPDRERCEECELEAARMAYAAELGASEWEAFIDRVPPCEGCQKVAVLLGIRPTPDPATPNKDWGSAASAAPCYGFCNDEGVGPFAGLFCVDDYGHGGGHLYEDPRDLAARLEAASARAKPADSSGLFAGHRGPGSGLAPAETVDE